MVFFSSPERFLWEPVLTSMAMSASVSSMMISPPEGRATLRWKVCSIWRSMLKRSKIAQGPIRRGQVAGIDMLDG
jgi:hypothetical protein